MKSAAAVPCESQLEWLELPERDVSPMAAAQLYYGADRLVCNYAGVSVPPTDVRGYWVHGWTPKFMCVDPDIALGDSVKNVKGTAWVGTEFVASYLRQQGCRARAIGLPIAYLPKKTYSRRRESLLVMPAHSLEYTKHGWSFEKYAQEIGKIRPLFDEVAVCLNAGCLKNGYWVKEFEAIGVPVVQGAAMEDRNALERMRALLSQFDYVTTNGFGSHLAYAAAFGAKVSIYGTFCEFEEEDFKDDYFYCSRPGLIGTALDLARESCVRQHLGEFFCHPREALERVDWGLEQIGYRNRLSPSELRRCFGLEWHRKAYDALSKRVKFVVGSATRRLLPGRLMEAVLDYKNPARKERRLEFSRLEQLGAGQAGVSVLAGETFYYADANTFAAEYAAVFDRAEVDFPCADSSPRIIDWGAGSGLALRYWAKKFPSPEIHVHEPASERREVLCKNVELSPNAKVAVHAGGDQLSTLLDEKVDFLRIDLGTAGCEMMCRVGEKISSIQRLLIVCRTHVHESQKVSRILALLESCGFRYHIVSSSASQNPLTLLRTSAGADCAIQVWGYRGERFPRTYPLPAKYAGGEV